MTDKRTGKRTGDQRANLIGGLVIIAVGVWFLLSNLGIDTPGMGRLWPVFPMLGGLLFVVMYASGREGDAGILIPGVAGLLIGLFFFIFTLGIVPWSAMGWLWPVFPLIGGIAFLATWFAGGGREAGYLIPGAMATLVGVVALFFTTVGWSLVWLGRWWPVILILVGISVLVRNMFNR